MRAVFSACKAAVPPAPLGVAVILLYSSGERIQGQERRWLTPPQPEVEIADRDGDYFGNPWQMVASPTSTSGGFVIVDDGVRLRAFSSVGDLRWVSGRRGGGPGEFQAILDVAFTANGQILVLDGDLARITILDGEAGEVVETVQLSSPNVAGADEIISMAPPELAMIQHGGDHDSNWSVLGGDGAVTETFGFSPQCEALVCESFTAGVTELGSGVVAFRWSSDLVFLNTDGSTRMMIDGVEPVRMPEPVRYNMDPKELGAAGNQFSNIVVTKVDPKAIEVTASLATDGSRVFVLTLGSSESRGRIVDTYLTENGKYHASFLLPRAVSEIAVVDGMLATLDTELFPTITLWTLPELSDKPEAP